MFAQFGEVKSAKVIKDKFTGESRGFGFIEMASASEAEQAISNLNGMDLEGRKLRVNEANPREERPRSPRPGGSSYPRRRSWRKQSLLILSNLLMKLRRAGFKTSPFCLYNYNYCRTLFVFVFNICQKPLFTIAVFNFIYLKLPTCALFCLLL